jgi:error-prone DNA polymerase
MLALRQRVPGLPPLTSAQVRAIPAGRRARIAGVIIVRQRPPTAGGVMFATLEDEDGFLDLILHQKVHEKYAELFLNQSFLIVQGVMQKDGESISMLVRSVAPAWPAAQGCKLEKVELGSRDFR